MGMSPADTWRSDSGTGQRRWGAVHGTRCFKLFIPSVPGKFGVMLLLGGGPALSPAACEVLSAAATALNAHPGVEARAEERSVFLGLGLKI